MTYTCAFENAWVRLIVYCKKGQRKRKEETERERDRERRKVKNKDKYDKR